MPGARSCRSASTLLSGSVPLRNRPSLTASAAAAIRVPPVLGLRSGLAAGPASAAGSVTRSPEAGPAARSAAVPSSLARGFTQRFSVSPVPAGPGPCEYPGPAPRRCPRHGRTAAPGPRSDRAAASAGGEEPPVKRGSSLPAGPVTAPYRTRGPGAGPSSLRPLCGRWDRSAARGNARGESRRRQVGRCVPPLPGPAPSVTAESRCHCPRRSLCSRRPATRRGLRAAPSVQRSRSFVTVAVGCPGRVRGSGR